MKSVPTLRPLEESNRVLVAPLAPQFRIRKKGLARLAEAILKRLGYRRTVLSLVLVTDRRMRRLNHRYLNHDRTTDVLAFPFSAPSFLGEIIISPARAKAYAKRLDVSFEEELARYVCHGILHLSGYSDTTAGKRKRMRSEENRLLEHFAEEIRRIV